MPRVPYETLFSELRRVLLKLGFDSSRAARCATLFAETSRDGVYSHGLNRFPRFVKMVERGVVDVHAAPACVARFGMLERWDGRRGPGNLNAYAAMERALALRNTNHWMRGGSYGWQAAEAGLVGMCWTNTQPNLPPWGARESRLGNNPLILAVPRAAGHVVLDMAMSQFSYGTLAEYRLRGKVLPVAGGFDAADELTRDPAAIEASGRPLPIGFWKGSGLALLLDLVAALLSGGQATHEIDPDPLQETNLSQVFVAFDPSGLAQAGDLEAAAEAIIADMLAAQPARPGERVYYPGEQTLLVREQNLAEGIPVEPSIWQQVQAM
jgi:3-dehydro-L-gulonate 2-dehydrogenase